MCQNGAKRTESEVRKAHILPKTEVRKDHILPKTEVYHTREIHPLRDTYGGIPPRDVPTEVYHPGMYLRGYPQGCTYPGYPQGCTYPGYPPWYTPTYPPWYTPVLPGTPLYTLPPSQHAGVLRCTVRCREMKPWAQPWE